MKSRNRWLTQHPLQVKYLALVVFAMLAPVLLVGYCFYRLVFYLLAKEMVFPEAILANLTPVLDRIHLILLVALPVLIVVIFWVAVVISHQLTGPIERLEQELDKVLSGDAHHRIYTRKNDDLRRVVQRINVLLSQLKK